MEKTLVLSFFIVVFVLPLSLCLIDKIWGTHLSCKYFGWHNGKDRVNTHFDGCSIHSRCSKCGKNVMQDSQGNWF